MYPLRPHHQYVPISFHRQVFDQVYFKSHSGILATRKLFSEQSFWPSMNTDVRNWTKPCIAWQKSKVQPHTVAPPGTFSTPDARFDRVHLDIVGPLPVSSGFRYLLSCIDHFTYWPDITPL